VSHTGLFRQLRRAVRQAHYAVRNGWSDDQLADHIAGAREKSTRRNFLKQSSLLAAAPVLLPHCLNPAKLSADHKDVVLILGGGVGGLTAAYTLKKAGIPFLVLESTARTGGRIHTSYNFNKEGQFLELGGELIDTQHTGLISLVREIGLDVENIANEQPGIEEELYFADGQFRTLPEVGRALKDFARALQEAKRAGAKKINPWTAESNPAAIQWDNMTGAEYLETLRGTLEPWLIKIINTGYTGEYGLDLDQQSALNLITLLKPDPADFELFMNSDESNRIIGGNSRLPARLAQLIGPAAIRMGTQVISIQRKGTTMTVIADEQGSRKEYQGTHVICALPMTNARELDGLEKLGITDAKLATIKNWSYGSNSKVFMEFSSRQWREKGHPTPASGGFLISDFATQAYWEATRRQSGKHGVLVNYVGGRAGLAPDVNNALTDLEKLHPGLRGKFLRSIVRNWNKSPVKGSYSCPRPGDYTKYVGVAAKPELDGQLLFAGEHVADENSGFMQGAVETGIAAAQHVIQSRLRTAATKMSGAPSASPSA
jgi:monoamine oxidase